MINVAAYLGLRWSEVAGLRVGRLDLVAAATLTVAETNAYVGGFADVKSPAARRTIALAPFLAEMLAAHLARLGLTAADATALVFCAPDGGRLYANNWPRRVWQPAVAASGVAVMFHGLRHTSVGLMVVTGAHPK
jgi:integrase